MNAPVPARALVSAYRRQERLCFAKDDARDLARHHKRDDAVLRRADTVAEDRRLEEILDALIHTRSTAAIDLLAKAKLAAVMLEAHEDDLPGSRLLMSLVRDLRALARDGAA